jgi:hypothetical protein
MFMPIKIDCDHCPPPPPPHKRESRDWELHPSWNVGLEALHAYSDWVNSVVLPVAFQWIEEHKPEVYALVPEELKDDVGVAMAAAFRLVKGLPAYKKGVEKRAAYEAAVTAGTWDPSKTNPVWTGIVNKVRACTEKAFEEQSSLLGDIPK